MSVVLVVFPGAPKVSPEAQQKDAQLDQLLETKVRGESLRPEVMSPTFTNEFPFLFSNTKCRYSEEKQQ
jgi:hypothetical protein